MPAPSRWKRWLEHRRKDGFRFSRLQWERAKSQPHGGPATMTACTSSATLPSSSPLSPGWTSRRGVFCRFHAASDLESQVCNLILDFNVMIYHDCNSRKKRRQLPRKLLLSNVFGKNLKCGGCNLPIFVVDTPAQPAH